jgi:hypothetical protein
MIQLMMHKVFHSVEDLDDEHRSCRLSPDRLNVKIMIMLEQLVLNLGDLGSH